MKIYVVGTGYKCSDLHFGSRMCFIQSDEYLLSSLGMPVIVSYCIYPKYCNTLSTYHTCPKI